MVNYIMKKISMYFKLTTFFVLMSSTLVTNADELKSNGLGLSQKQWEINHKKTGKDIIGIIYDEKYIVQHFGKNIKYIEHKKNTSEEQIIKESSKLIPNDAIKIKSYSPEGRPETIVIIYKSKYLQNRFKADKFINAKSGVFILQYNRYKNDVGRFIISIGNNP